MPQPAHLCPHPGHHHAGVQPADALHVHRQSGHVAERERLPPLEPHGGPPRRPPRRAPAGRAAAPRAAGRRQRVHAPRLGAPVVGARRQRRGGGARGLRRLRGLGGHGGAAREEPAPGAGAGVVRLRVRDPRDGGRGPAHLGRR